MIVSNFAKEVKLRSREHERSSNAVHRRIAPSFIVESTSCIKMIEVFHVRIRTEEIEVSNLKI